MKESKLQENITHTELIIQNIIDRIIDFVPDLIKAILIFIVGILLIRIALKIVKRRFEARNISLSVRSFVISTLRFILYGLLILIIASNLGIKTTAILGALSGIVLAIGLSLQGSLSNFAGGILILLFRPFDVGDYIENNSGTDGTVEKIDLLYTSLRTSSGILVFSPNGTLANSVTQPARLVTPDNTPTSTSAHITPTSSTSYHSVVQFALLFVLPPIPTIPFLRSRSSASQKAYHDQANRRVPPSPRLQPLPSHAGVIWTEFLSHEPQTRKDSGKGADCECHERNAAI